jgi:hypothetical protein
MKKTISLIILIINVIVIKTGAQEIKVGGYYPNRENKKFEGTWKFADANNNLTIVFVNKERVLLTGFDLYVDKLEGTLTYTKNEIKVIDNQKVISGGSSDKEKPYLLLASYRDPDSNSLSGRLTVTFPDRKDLKTILVKVTPSEIHIKKFQRNQTLRIPNQFLLKKQ